MAPPAAVLRSRASRAVRRVPRRPLRRCRRRAVRIESRPMPGGNRRTQSAAVVEDPDPKVAVRLVEPDRAVVGGRVARDVRQGLGDDPERRLLDLRPQQRQRFRLEIEGRTTGLTHPERRRGVAHRTLEPVHVERGRAAARRVPGGSRGPPSSASARVRSSSAGTASGSVRCAVPAACRPERDPRERRPEAVVQVPAQPIAFGEGCGGDARPFAGESSASRARSDHDRQVRRQGCHQPRVLLGHLRSHRGAARSVNVPSCTPLCRSATSSLGRLTAPHLSDRSAVDIPHHRVRRTCG